MRMLKRRGAPGTTPALTTDLPLTKPLAHRLWRDVDFSRWRLKIRTPRWWCTANRSMRRRAERGPVFK